MGGTEVEIVEDRQPLICYDPIAGVYIERFDPTARHGLDAGNMELIVADATRRRHGTNQRTGLRLPDLQLQVRELLLSDRGITLADVFTAGGTVLVGTARWEHEREVRQSTIRARAERTRRRRIAEQEQARIRAQIAALQAELEEQRAEADLLQQQDADEQNRRGNEHEELLRLRHADPDTEAVDEPSRAHARR